MTSTNETSKIKVSIYGPVASGKTVFLTSLFHHILWDNSCGDFNIIGMNEKMSKLHEDMIKGKWPKPTPFHDDKERFVYKYKNKIYEIVSLSGEKTYDGKTFNVTEIINEYKNSGSKVFIGVINPFFVDSDLAYDCFLNLIAYIQMAAKNNGLLLSIAESCKLAAKAMFSYSFQDFDNTPSLEENQKEFLYETKLQFYYTKQDVEDIKKRVENNKKTDLKSYLKYEPDNQDEKDEIFKILKLFIKNLFDSNQIQYGLFRSILREIPDDSKKIIILSYYDIRAFMGYITDKHFEPVFEKIVNDIRQPKRNRFYFEYIRTEIVLSESDDESDRIRPKEFRVSRQFMNALLEIISFKENWLSILQQKAKRFISFISRDRS